MKNNTQILNAVKVIAISLLTIGMILFAIGFFGSSYSALTAIGIGTISGAVLIFVMGLFFVATEEMLMKAGEGNKS